jgi:hypothetical protein
MGQHLGPPKSNNFGRLVLLLILASHKICERVFTRNDRAIVHRSWEHCPKKIWRAIWKLRTVYVWTEHGWSHQSNLLLPSTYFRWKFGIFTLVKNWRCNHLYWSKYRTEPKSCSRRRKEGLPYVSMVLPGKFVELSSDLGNIAPRRKLWGQEVRSIKGHIKQFHCLFYRFPLKIWLDLH